MNASATTLLITFSVIPCAFTTTSLASERSSTNYSITTETTDTGGREATSANYTSIGSAGLIAGITNSATNTVNKSGYIAQLYTVEGLTINPEQVSVNEGSTCQINGYANVDDGTFLALSPQELSWGIVSGPVSQIDTSGLANTTSIYQTEIAQISASWSGYSTQTSFSVNNVGTDNFGIYANDNVDDAWQAHHFGENNPLGAGSQDPDGDGNNNWEEFITGTAPTDVRSIFRPTSILGETTLTLTIPTIEGRQYEVKTSSDLNTWTPYTQFSGDGSDVEVEITGVNSEDLLFYRVGVSIE